MAKPEEMPLAEDLIAQLYDTIPAGSDEVGVAAQKVSNALRLIHRILVIHDVALKMWRPSDG